MSRLPLRPPRLLATALLLLAFHALPWVQWEGRQALLLDLSARRFDIFGLTLWPDDLGLLLGLLAVMASALALLTHLGGRLWCGHACPQTVWSAAFDGIAGLTRRWLRPPWLEFGVRHLLWASLAVWTAVSFVGLFSPIHGLLGRAPHAGWSDWELFWVLFYAAATWGNAGFLRRQVCRTLCPFARVQPLLQDGHTPRMLYLAPRGEPRGPRPLGLGSVQARGRGLLDATTAQDYVFRAAHAALSGGPVQFSSDRLGDCTDCGDCVRACPLQLDVRNGPQADCVACGACSHACAQAQQQAGLGHRLIAYVSPERHVGAPIHWLRPRTLVLLVLLGALLAAAYVQLPR